MEYAVLFWLLLLCHALSIPYRHLFCETALTVLPFLTYWLTRRREAIYRHHTRRRWLQCTRHQEHELHRPVCNLTFVSKLVERVAVKQLDE